ncbi:MAG: hypothetical protein AAFO76_09415 [Cyanobacteria bacterium J06607_15]
MKLKSLLAIVSCSAIALSISLPSVAETVRDSKVESGSIVIGNKDYRNKQSTPSIVGSWKSSVVDNEYKHVNPTEINIDIKSDNTIIYAFQTKKGNSLSEIHFIELIVVVPSEGFCIHIPVSLGAYEYL